MSKCTLAYSLLLEAKQRVDIEMRAIQSLLERGAISEYEARTAEAEITSSLERFKAECMQSSIRPNQSDRRTLSSLNFILYVLCASAVALLSIILNNPEATQEGMRNIAGKFFQPSPIDGIKTETLFDQAMMREVLRLSTIDEQLERGKFKLEKLPLDLSMETVIGGFNPALSRTTYEDIVNMRSAIEQLSRPYLRTFDLMQWRYTEDVFFTDYFHRTSINTRLEEIEIYLGKNPDDSNVYLWAGILYFRLGDYSNSRKMFSMCMALVDIYASQICPEPSFFDLNFDDEKENWVTLEYGSLHSSLRTEKQYDFSFFARNSHCIIILSYRYRLARNIAETYNFESRDADSNLERSRLLKEFFNALEDSYRKVNSFDIWNPFKPIASAFDLSMPYLTKTVLRHHMQQFEYLYNLTISECLPGSKVALNMIKQHGSCDEAGKKFFNLAESYRNALYRSSLVHVRQNGTSIEDSYQGLRVEETDEMKDRRDVIIMPSSASMGIASSILRPVHFEGTEEVPEGILNRDVNNWKYADTQWNVHRETSALVLDEVFSKEGLEALRRFTEGNFMWHNAKVGGYICSFMDYGFASPITAQLTNELRAALPTVFCDHMVTNVWGYKYADGDSGQGINAHSDHASVNVNCWTTSEEFVEDTESGGMVIWPTKPDDSTDLSAYNLMGSPFGNLSPEGLIDMSFKNSDGQNNETLSPALKFAYSTESGNPKLVVPYKSNRCVIFDSTFVHATNSVHFGKGYKNRRINLTLLFGEARGTCQKAADARKVSKKASTLSQSEQLEKQAKSSRSHPPVQIKEL